MSHPFDNAPTGLGLWIAFEHAIDAGPKADDLRHAIESCKAAGVTWVACRGGAGGANDPDVDTDAEIEQTVSAFNVEGIDVYVWVFAYKATLAKEISAYALWFKHGAKGAIINAEFPYESASEVDARNLVRGIREAWTSVHGADSASSFVAHAPPDYLGAGVGHALRNALVALDQECDAIMPQIYWWEHDDSGQAYHMNRVLNGYNARGYGADKVWPVGCTYRPFDRGGKKLSPLDNQAEKVAAEVIAFLDNAGTRKVRAPSLYSLDAMSFINGVQPGGDKVLAALTEYAKGTEEVQPKQPETAAEPLGWQDRAEQDADG